MIHRPDVTPPVMMAEPSCVLRPPPKLCRKEPLWSSLGAADLPDTMLVVGSLDTKYVKESERMLRRMLQGHERQEASDVAVSSMSEGRGRHRRVVVAGCGHAVHIEAPLELWEVLRSLLGSRSDSSYPDPDALKEA